MLTLPMETKDAGPHSWRGGGPACTLPKSTFFSGTVPPTQMMEDCSALRCGDPSLGPHTAQGTSSSVTKPFPSHSHCKVLDFWPPCSITFLGFPDSSVGKESACNARDPGLIPGSGRFAGEGIGYPLQCCWVSLVAHLVKNLPPIWETWV